MMLFHWFLVRFAAGFLIGLLLDLFAHGAEPWQASYRIDVPQGDGSFSGGSSTFIHPHIAVTNKHVVGNAKRARLKHQHAADWLDGWVVATDPAADLALVLCPEAQPQVFAPLAERGPAAGQRLTFCGYGSDRVLKTGVGECRGRVATRDGIVPVLETHIASISGDSGGGLFDEAGNLVAVNWGADPRNDASQSTPVEFLRALGERWATQALPEDRWQEVQCFGGRCAPQRPLFPGLGQGGGGVSPKLPVPPGGGQQPPLSPMPPATQPQPQPIAPANPLDEKKLADMLAEKMACDPRFRGPPGAMGPPGANGKDAAVDYAALANEVLLRLPPLHFEVLDPNGKVLDQSTRRLGETLRLQLKPIPAE